MSTKLPLVSVNVVVYRQAAFVAETLDSILAQDYPNIEIVVTDDASPDATPEILQSYAAKHKNIKLVLNKVNGGVSVNCNKGLAACTGELICPFAGDDVMLPGKISKQVAVMMAEPECVLNYHNMEWFDSETGGTLRNHYEKGRTPQPSETADALFAENFIGGPAVMVRAWAVPEGGYDVRFPFAGDWLIWLHAASRGRIRYLDEVLVRYRRHGDNETRVNPRIGAEQLAFVKHVAQTFPQAPEAALRRARALAHSAKAVGALGQGKAWEALQDSIQTMRYGRVTPKVLVGTAMAAGMLVMPKAARLRIWQVYAARRFG